MRVLSLKLENVGPFDQAELEFVGEEDEQKAPITLLTGINGTGKTIILDAIRGMFGEQYCKLARPIWRDKGSFSIELVARYDGTTSTARAVQALAGALVVEERSGSSPVEGFTRLPIKVSSKMAAPDWVVEFWGSTLGTGSYEIQSLVAQEHAKYLVGALQGAFENKQVTELVCNFDYLRDSRNPRHKLTGEVLYDKTRAIVEASLLDGELVDVDRSTFTPMVRQSGQVVPIGRLSSGNAYLVQHMISMLGKMFAVHTLRETDPTEIGTTPGVLLIDEAESYLHPQWQKQLFKIIHEVFPNLQIIAATHSPFILAAAPHARVYVCRYEKERGSCIVEDASDGYVNRPVEDILISDAFDNTQPFGAEISKLIVERKQAILRGDKDLRKQIEDQLKRKNPEYFSYFDVEENLRALGAAK